MSDTLKIILIGPNGQLGWELQRSLAPLGEVIAMPRHSVGGVGDLAKPEDVSRMIRHSKPDVVVNAAAYTAVDQAEAQAAVAHAINAEAPAALAKAAQSVGAWMVHFSTDYVFNGQGERPWSEADVTGPLSVYGRTKLLGEQAVAAACEKHLVLRTSWVHAARGNNFARTMLRLAAERERLQVVSDQWGAPTSAELLADATAHALRKCLGQPSLAGLYHLAAAGETTWHAYAQYAVAQAIALGCDLKVTPSQVIPISSDAYPTPAVRPYNSRLDTAKFREVFALNLPPWQQGVSRTVSELVSSRQAGV